MSSKEKKYIIGLVLITILVVTVRLLQPKPIDWSEGYSSTEKKPYGGYILFNQLATLFPDKTIDIHSEPIFEQFYQEESMNLIYINSSLTIDEFETEILLDGVKKGNNVFIATKQLEGALADTLNIQLTPNFPIIPPHLDVADSVIKNQINFTNQNLDNNADWLFPMRNTNSYFASFDTSKTTILGEINNQLVNFIRIDLEHGSLFVHSNPLLFTNYFLTDIHRFDYAFTALSFLPIQDVIWDEYYKASRASFSSSLSYVVSQPNLRLAWFIALGSLIVYLVFGAKRKQRIIPELKPIKNTSIQFTSTIANLYLNNGTHKDILDKKILFFFDYIRTNLQIKVEDSENFINQISNRSGINREEINDLFSAINTAQTETNITQKRLKQITDQIDWFYKHSLR